MRKAFLFIIAVVAMFSISACQQETLSDVKEEPVSTYSRYLEINADLEHTEMTNLTIEEEQVYNEARGRFDKIVDYKNQQFYLLHSNYKAMNISKELFDHFEKIMNSSNEEIRGLSPEQVGQVAVYSDISTNLRVKTRAEGIVSGGISGFQKTWWGFKIYLSNTDLLLIAGAGGAVSYIGGLIPDPTLATKFIAGACYLVSAIATLTAGTCPNGIVISVATPLPSFSACIPFDISKQ